MITSLDALAQRAGLSPENPLTFDMDAYRKTFKELQGSAVELTSLVQALNQLASSPETQKWLPVMENGMEKFSGEGKSIINHFFLMAFLAIVFSMVGFFALRLTYHYALNRFKIHNS